MSPAKRRRRRWILIPIGVVALCGLAVLGLWSALQSTPDWYRPQRVPREQLQAVRNDLTHAVNELSARMVARRPFEYTIRQDQFNEWLSARMAIWPGLKRWIPPWLEDPVVVLEAEHVVLAGVVRWAGSRAVASLHLGLTADDDGLRVRLHRVQAGHLPMPLDWFRDRIEQALLESQSDRDPDDRITATHLFGEADLPNQFVWFNGKVPFRLTGIAPEAGQVRLQFEPEPRTYSRYP